MAKEQEEQRKKEMETFIKEVMDNSEFTEEQSDYLLTCLERGDKVEDVLYLAKPSLSVEHMERMRKMEQKRRMEQAARKHKRNGTFGNGKRTKAGVFRISEQKGEKWT